MSRIGKSIERESGLVLLRARRERDGMGFLSEWGNALESVVMAAQVWEYTGNYWLSHFKKVNFMVFEYLKIKNSEKLWPLWHLATLYPNTLLQALGNSRFHNARKLFLGINSNAVFLANRHFPTYSDKIYWSSNVCLLWEWCCLST